MSTTSAATAGSPPGRLPVDALTAQVLVERALAAHSGRLAAVAGERTLTYRDLSQRTARLGQLLQETLGGTGVAAAYVPNRLEYLELDVACTRSGIVRVGIGERLSGDEVGYILGQSGAGVLLTTPVLLERVGELPDCVRLVLVVGDSEPGAQRHGAAAVRGYEEALSSARASSAFRRVAPHEPNYILYTSGTTGRPKGATHSHGGRAAALLNMLASELVVPGALRLLHLAPLTHGSGSKVLTVLARGGTNILRDRFEPEELPAVVAELAPTHTFLVPTMIDRIVDGGADVQRAAASLTQISFGGSPISSTSFATAIDRIGPIFTQVYGSCEAPHPITVLRPLDYVDGDDRMLISAGRAADSVALRVAAADGEVGELEVDAPHLMTGYWCDEQATGDVFTADGWYVTGDLARISDDGVVTFQDRKRDLIISGGMNIYPSEVERVIAEHPAVREVVVVGYPDPQWGESVLAFVVAESPGAVTPDDIVEFCRSRLAGYKKPRRVEFLDQMPLGPSNKVLRQELRERLWRGEQRRIN